MIRVAVCVFLSLPLIVAGCDDGPLPAAPTVQPQVAKTVAAPVVASKPAVKAAVRPELADRDFNATEHNRDPFISDLKQPPPKPGGIKFTGKLHCPKFALDELKLIAVIGGGTGARAMFRTPRGKGVVVKRGDHLGASADRVSRIFSDRVIIERRVTSEDEQKSGTQVIRLHGSAKKPT